MVDAATQCRAVAAEYRAQVSSTCAEHGVRLLTRLESEQMWDLLNLRNDGTYEIDPGALLAELDPDVKAVLDDALLGYPNRRRAIRLARERTQAKVGVKAWADFCNSEKAPARRHLRRAANRSAANRSAA